jgi:hypothetical protein
MLAQPHDHLGDPQPAKTSSKLLLSKEQALAGSRGAPAAMAAQFQSACVPHLAQGRARGAGDKGVAELVHAVSVRMRPLSVQQRVWGG